MAWQGSGLIFVTALSTTAPEEEGREGGKGRRGKGDKEIAMVARWWGVGPVREKYSMWVKTGTGHLRASVSILTLRSKS